MRHFGQKIWFHPPLHRRPAAGVNQNWLAAGQGDRRCHPGGQAGLQLADGAPGAVKNIKKQLRRQISPRRLSARAGEHGRLGARHGTVSQLALSHLLRVQEGITQKKAARKGKNQRPLRRQRIIHKQATRRLRGLHQARWSLLLKKRKAKKIRRESRDSLNYPRPLGPFGCTGHLPRLSHHLPVIIFTDTHYNLSWIPKSFPFCYY